MVLSLKLIDVLARLDEDDALAHLSGLLAASLSAVGGGGGRRRLAA